MEEQNFEIEYIKGKDADALSRIHIDELKTIRVFTHQVLKMTTRSMTQNKHSNLDKNKDEAETAEPKI